MTRHLNDVHLPIDPLSFHSENATPTDDIPTAKTSQRIPTEHDADGAQNPVRIIDASDAFALDNVHHVKHDPPPSKTKPFTSNGSYFSPQPCASGLEARSPAIKRAPASHSSHGIETSNGPPPALSTQRSHSTDNAWRLSLQPEYHRTRSPLIPRYPTGTATPQEQNSSVKIAPRLDPSPTPLSPRSIGKSKAGHPELNTEEMPRFSLDHSHQPLNEEDEDQTLHVNPQQSQPSSRFPGEEIDQAFQDDERTSSSQEDLFLNLARADTLAQKAVEPASRDGRQRSRLYEHQSIRHSSHSSSTARPSSSGTDGSPHWYEPKQYQHEAHLSLNQLQPTEERVYAASAHPLDTQSNQRQIKTPHKPSFSIDGEGLNRKTSQDVDLFAGQRKSMVDSVQRRSSRAYKKSSPSHNSISLPINGRRALAEGQQKEASLETHQAEGTESTASMTAPSTVWDELDDLKSRLRKLELTGNLPSSSHAAMSRAFGERPRTATTTMTTISSSPKRGRLGSVSPSFSTSGGLGVPDTHPLLHTALAKAQPVMDQNPYKALQATASDALDLASIISGSNGQAKPSSPASVLGSVSHGDRQLRRKAESLCRSVTELCIALSNVQPYDTKSKIEVESGGGGKSLNRQDHMGGLELTRLSREASLEPEIRSSSRVMNRLEARRSSMLGLQSLSNHENTAQRSPQELVRVPQTPRTAGHRLASSSTLHLRSLREGEIQTQDSLRRPLSRAMTEVGQEAPASPRSLPRERVSREYTSQHPLPASHLQSPQQRSPSRRTSIPVRQSLLSSVPSTPAIQQAERRTYSDRHTPLSADSAKLAEARQRRLASLGSGRQRRGSFGAAGVLGQDTRQRSRQQL